MPIEYTKPDVSGGQLAFGRDDVTAPGLVSLVSLRSITLSGAPAMIPEGAEFVATEAQAKYLISIRCAELAPALVEVKVIEPEHKREKCKPKKGKGGKKR